MTASTYKPTTVYNSATLCSCSLRIFMAFMYVGIKEIMLSWRSWIRASWYNYESNQQDATIQVNLLFL